MNKKENDNNLNILETKEFKLLFNLLEKAEQILSIINLSDTSISKYNTLKKITFEMLNLEFKPLEKRYIKTQVSTPVINSEKNQNEIIPDDSLYILHFINIKKSLLIDLMLNYISNLNSQQQNLDNYLNSLTDIYNISPDIITSKSANEIIAEAKNEEANISALFTNVDQIFVKNFESIGMMQKNLEEINKIKNDSNYFVDSAINIINENYEKYLGNNKGINMNNFNSIAYKDGKVDENILKLEFIKNVFDTYFNNNNTGINLQNKENAILNDICDSLPEIIKDNDIFHKNFQDLMNYISTNIEGKII